MLPRTDPEGSGLPLNDQSHPVRRGLGRAVPGDIWQLRISGHASLEQIRGLGVDGDAGGVDVADDVSFQIQLRVVLIDGEATGVAVAIGRESDVLADVGGPLHRAIGVKAQSEVIEGVCVAARFCPDAEAEVCGGGRTGRVQDFGVVGVPLGEACVYNRAVGDGRIGGALGNEDDMPEANYGNVGIALVVLGDARAGLDGGAERNRPGQQTVGVVHCGMAVT
jgi:hypothetical protein